MAVLLNFSGRWLTALGGASLLHCNIKTDRQLSTPRSRMARALNQHEIITIWKVFDHPAG
jgi:hypothetical protein